MTKTKPHNNEVVASGSDFSSKNMKHSKKKKGLLSIAFSLIPAAVTMLVKGQTIEGSILAGIAVVLILLYDYYDDKAKAVPDFVRNIDPEVFERVAEVGAEQTKEVLDSYQSKEE